ERSRVTGSNNRLAKRNDFEPLSILSRAWATRAARSIGKVIDHQPGRGLGATDHAGNTSTGMGAGTDKVQVRQSIVAVVDAEKGALRQQRLETEGRAVKGAEVVGEVLRSVVERHFNFVA